MRKFLKFVHDDVVYCIYYEVVDILFHIGSELPAKECIIVQFKRKKPHDHERKRKHNLLGDRMAYVN